MEQISVLIEHWKCELGTFSVIIVYYVCRIVYQIWILKLITNSFTRKKRIKRSISIKKYLKRSPNNTLQCFKRIRPQNNLLY